MTKTQSVLLLLVFLLTSTSIYIFIQKSEIYQLKEAVDAEIRILIIPSLPPTTPTLWDQIFGHKSYRYNIQETIPLDTNEFTEKQYCVIALITYTPFSSDPFASSELKQEFKFLVTKKQNKWMATFLEKSDMYTRFKSRECDQKSID